MLVILTALVAALLAAWIYKDNFLTKRPPGPLRLPILGTLLQLGVDKNRPQFITFRSLSKKYGPISSIKIGLYDGVIFDDFETIKKVLNHELWVNRFWNGLFAERSFGKELGIIFIDGDTWKEMRRFTMRTLRDFGYGKSMSMESVLEDKVKELLLKIDRLRKDAESFPDKKGVVDMKHIFTLPVLNVLWNMVCSVRSADDDQKLEKLLELVERMTRATPMGGGIMVPFPFLRHVPLISKLTGNDMLRECNKKVQEYFWSILHARREEGVYKSDQRDYIDVFLKEIDRHKEIGSNPNFYTDEQFVITTIDLFEAGAETTNNTLEFCFYYILQNPGVQVKLQEEIDRVVGRSRLPTIADKAEMPYTEAVITEAQRLGNVLPMTVRSPTEDTWVEGFYMPKGVVGFVNIYSVHMDERFWGDPEKFRPERFLTEDRKLIPEKMQRVIPFGAGRRACLGEVLARATLFTYLTSLLQSFSFEKVGNTAAEKDHVLGFTLTPPPFSARISKRL